MLREQILGAVLIAVPALAVGVLLWRFLRKSPDPAEIERLRRSDLNGRGRLGHGEVIDLDGATVVYAYHVGGVGYTASQDARAVEALLPADRMSAIGPVLVKFDPRNPANSIVLCENWTGFRRGGETALPPGHASMDS